MLIAKTIFYLARIYAAYFRGEKSVADLLKTSKNTGNSQKLLSVFDEYKFRTLYSADENVKMN